MGRLNGVLSVVVLTSLVAGTPDIARAQSAARRAQPGGASATPSAGPIVGAISGTVSDEHGGPLSGAIVSVLGTATMAMDVTDGRGRFSLERLPVGNYLLRARLPGFAASPHEVVNLSSGVAAVYRLQLRRLARATGTLGQPLTTRPIVTAGFELPDVDLPDSPGTVAPPADDDHPQTETAWQLRHLTRTVLKDSADTAVVAEEPEVRGASRFGRAMDSAVGVAASIFGDLPISGEVNLLTTSAFSPGTLFGGNALPRGVAYLSIGAPTPAGDWLMRAAMSDGDLSSWIVAGSFVSHRVRDSMHSYDLGFSYSTQDYQGGNPMALAAFTDGTRNVGEVFAVDRWSLAPGVAVEYGGRYGRYDYLEDHGLLSPRVAFEFEPAKGTRISTVLTQRMVAPGAEEFLAPRVPGPWLPPERTFSSLAQDRLRVERARSLEVLVEHDFSHSIALGIRHVSQRVDNQLVTLFGLTVPGGPASVGHYYVSNAGPVEAQGWAFRLSTPAGQRVRASVDYSLTNATWSGRPDQGTLGAWAPAAVRAESEYLHDITTSFATDIAETATRVFVLYKVNTGYTRSNAAFTRPGLDARFDVQVNQALPFEVAGTKWEVLLGLRNLFRDPTDPASVYDELLVMRPPKRVVGGFLVRF